MKSKLFAVYDSKAECYGTPFFMPNRGMAMRAFGDLVKDASTMIGKHPVDYSLFELGEFDDQTGEIQKCAAVNLGLAAAFQSAAFKRELINAEEVKSEVNNGAEVR